ncbi:E3 ubiquitin-protein ligase At1g12760-like isoform X2 [Malania oleifera]|uniref:E3 ubiquitin-protein ligase At1g12760-like isoform X2 n=1 Tax=Malania oleifera TaxID=397392 RepID=UPI0025ADEB2D|nr:E3 ubiquitin-protein ligase At1g12760-like isoform X2 [Malania oleifera]
MATSNSPHRSSEDVADSSTPLLANSSSSESDRGRRSMRRQSLREAARFLRRASSRRMMREPSMLVRETAAEQLEERQSDWAYSRPVVVLDIIWNIAFVVVAAAVMVLSRKESPTMPLRVWIVGYALQCVLHILCVCIEYRRRRRRVRAFSVEEDGRGSGSRGGSGDSPSPEESHYVSLVRLEEEGSSSCAKHLESANTMFSFIWWIIGFYWVSAGGQTLAHDSPQLYWLCIIFLAFDVFFVVFCVALACVIGIAVCCCLPCIIAILYAVADQEGASKEDIEQLLKYKFQKIGNIEKHNGEIQVSRGGIMTECGTGSPVEHVLSAEDAECCICLSAYEDGIELRELPCGHHFHCTCVDKWLHINATCPLCKYNILKSSSHGREEV